MAHDPHPEGAAQDEESTAGMPGQGADDNLGPLRKQAALPKRATPSGLVRRQVPVQDLKRDQQTGDDGKASQDEAHRATRTTDEGRMATEKRTAFPAASTASRREAAERLPPHQPIEAWRESWPERGAGAGETAGSRPARRRRKGRGPEGEEAWTGNQSSLWFVLAGLACVLIVGYFLAVSLNRSDPAPVLEAPERTVETGTIDEIPIAEFVARSDELLPIVSEILEQAEGSEGEGLARLVRGGAESAARRAQWRVRGGAPARYLPVKDRQLHAAAVADMGYLVLVGLDADNLLAAAYFVKEGEDIKFDWEASEGYSELPLSEVEALDDDEPRLLRVVVSLSEFYPEPFPEQRYRCYSFHRQDPDEFVWGFAERDSRTDRSLLASFLAPDLTGIERRATITVRKGPAGARANQLEVVDFLHTDWISPD